MKREKIDPGIPGLYECHYLYSIGKEKFMRYIVVLINTVNFTKAYNMGLIQLETLHPHTPAHSIRVHDNLLNLITDPIAYTAQ